MATILGGGWGGGGRMNKAISGICVAAIARARRLGGNNSGWGVGGGGRLNEAISGICVAAIARARRLGDNQSQSFE